MTARVKNRLILVAAVVEALVCAGAISAAPKTYVFGHRWTMPAQLEAVNAIVADFNKSNPDLQFTVDPISADKQEKMLYMQYAAGNQPLVAWMTMAQSSTLNNRGLLANLKPYYDKYGLASRIPAGQLVTYTDKNGAIFSMPVEGYAFTIIHYSTKVFQQLGIPKPSRDTPMAWADFIALCNKIKAAGIAPITLGNRDGWTLQHLISFYTMEELPVKEADDLWSKSTGPSVTDPRPLDGLTKLWTLIKSGYFASGINAMSDDEARMLLYTGKVAMYHIGEWWPLMLTGDKMVGKFEADFFPIPKLRDDVPYKMMGAAHGFTVPKNGDLNAAARFINFFTSIDNMKKMAKTGVATTIIGTRTADVVPDPISLSYPLLYKHPQVNTESNEDVLVAVRNTGGALVDAKNEADVRAVAEQLQKVKVEILKKAEAQAQR